MVIVSQPDEEVLKQCWNWPKRTGGSAAEMFEILPRDWSLWPIFTQKWAYVDMNWGGGQPPPPTIPTLVLRGHHYRSQAGGALRTQITEPPTSWNKDTWIPMSTWLVPATAQLFTHNKASKRKEITDKRFRLLRSTLPFHVVCLPIMFVHYAQTAEDIDSRHIFYCKGPTTAPYLFQVVLNITNICRLRTKIVPRSDASPVDLSVEDSHSTANCGRVVRVTQRSQLTIECV